MKPSLESENISPAPPEEIFSLHVPVYPHIPWVYSIYIFDISLEFKTYK
jgi:hypothetical protein